MAKNYVAVPSIYPKLLELRKSTTAEFKKNRYLKESTKLRYYQVVGSLHMLLLERMVLGDSCGLGKCVSAGTYIPTSLGIRKISDFAFPRMKADTFCPLPEDLYLLSNDGEVTPSGFYYSGTHDGLKVVTDYGYEIEGLPHHPVLCKTLSGFEYKQLSQLKVGDYVCICKKGLFSEKKYELNFDAFDGCSDEYGTRYEKENLPKYLEEDIAYILGFYLEEEIKTNMREAFKAKQFPEVRNWLSLFGFSKDVSVNEIPDMIFLSPKEVIRSFISGNFARNGFISNKGIFYFNFVSKRVARQFQILLLNFGVVTKRRRKRLYRLGKNPTWVLYVSGFCLDTFRSEIGCNEEKFARLRVSQGKKTKEVTLDRLSIPFMSRALMRLFDAFEQKRQSRKESKGWRLRLDRLLVDRLNKTIYNEKSLKDKDLKQVIDALRVLSGTRLDGFKELEQIYEEGYFYDKVTKIKEIKKRRFYDFHVPGKHCFAGNGFINHNTVQIIGAYTFLLQMDPTLKLLVICPNSATFQWQEEFDKFTTGISSKVITNKYTGFTEGYEARKHQYETFKDNVLIVNYNIILNEYDIIRGAVSPNYAVVFDECFSYDTGVLLSDGSEMVIGDIVLSEKPVEVMTLNRTTGELEAKRVVNYYRSRADLWHRIKGVKTREVLCSMSHKFYTPIGEKRAIDLREGDVIYVFIGGTLHTDTIQYSRRAYDIQFCFRFNIEVEGNHNYFAGGILVGNCTAFKNRKTQTHFACEQIAEGSRRAYGLSATIIKNGLEEVWGIYSVIVPGLFGNITRFKKTYCIQEFVKLGSGSGKGVRDARKKVKWIPRVIGYKNLDTFKKVLDPYFLIRRKEQVASELPKLISKKIILEMLPQQKELYRQALSGILYEERVTHEYFELSDRIRNGESGASIVKKYEKLREKYDKFLSPEGRKRGKLAALVYCQMVSNGPQLLNEMGESSKEIEFLRMMKEELLTEKVILFTRFKRGIPILEIICRANNISYTMIHGDISDRERQKARLKFQEDPSCNLIFITTAGSEALNLQAASTLIFYDTPWAYGQVVQTIGRAQRIGSLQEHIYIIHFINKGSIDVRVISKVSEKKGLSDKVLGDTAEGALDFVSQEATVIDDLYDDLLRDAGELS